MRKGTNMGPSDRIIRGLVGIVLALWGAFGTLTVGPMLVVFAVSAVMLVTAFAGYCPAYAVFHLSTDHGIHRVAH